MFEGGKKSDSVPAAVVPAFKPALPARGSGRRAQYFQGSLHVPSGAAGIQLLYLFTSLR
jgi:hypothetical protein